MSTRFNYVEYDEETMKNRDELEEIVYKLEGLIESKFSQSREKSLAITKLEECWMWIGKTLKVEQEDKEIAKKSPQKSLDDQEQFGLPFKEL